MKYIGKIPNGFNQVSQSALAITVNGIDEILITTSSLTYTGSAVITGSLNVTQGITGSLLGTASYALNSGANAMAFFLTSSTWTFNHSIGNQFVVVQTFDDSYNQIIPQNIELTNANTATITFPTTQSGYALASLGGSSGTPYKKYVALLTQTGTNAPIATVLENTIGNVVWGYSAAGQYTGSLSGAFPATKYFSPTPTTGYDAEVNNGGGGDPYNYYRFDNDKIVVTTSGDGILNNSPIEIRVYP